MTYGTDRINEERNAQVLVNGYTPDHDDGHDGFELTRAAAAYLLYVELANTDRVVLPMITIRQECAEGWPWENGFRPSDDPIKNLVRAGALIAAEIDRLHRQGVDDV